MTTVELVRAPNTRRYDEKAERYVGESFERGERIIMVDGVRWGRTRVKSHGSRGTTTTFEQHGGEALLAERNKRWSEIGVRSMNKRHERIQAIGAHDANRNGGWRPTEELVLEKVRELVENGKLRHPDIVKAEQEQAMRLYQERAAERDKERIEAFRTKAMEALQINDPASEIIDRVVKAMEWAQSQ